LYQHERGADLAAGQPIDLDEAKVRTARKLHDDQTLTIDDICQDANHLTVHVFPIRADEEEVTASVSQRSFFRQSQNPVPLMVSPDGYRKLRRFLGIWSSAARDAMDASTSARFLAWQVPTLAPVLGRNTTGVQVERLSG
jgi:hypothetical protein